MLGLWIGDLCFFWPRQGWHTHTSATQKTANIHTTSTTHTTQHTKGGARFARANNSTDGARASRAPHRYCCFSLCVWCECWRSFVWHEDRIYRIYEISRIYRESVESSDSTESILSIEPIESIKLWESQTIFWLIIKLRNIGYLRHLGHPRYLLNQNLLYIRRERKKLRRFH